MVLEFVEANQQPQVPPTFSRLPNCRACEGFKPEELLKVNFEKMTASNAKARRNFIATLLKSGIKVGHRIYHFYGCSNSGLKNAKAFMLNRPIHEIDATVTNMGDFTTLRSCAKLTKRIGLLFSEMTPVWNLDPSRTSEVEDVHSYTGEQWIASAEH